MVKAEVVQHKHKEKSRNTNQGNWLYIIIGLFCLILGITFIWNLAWEFIKFGIGLILILIGLGFLGSRRIVSIRF